MEKGYEHKVRALDLMEMIEKVATNRHRKTTELGFGPSGRCLLLNAECLPDARRGSIRSRLAWESRNLINALIFNFPNSTKLKHPNDVQINFMALIFNFHLSSKF